MVSGSGDKKILFCLPNTLCQNKRIYYLLYSQVVGTDFFYLFIFFYIMAGLLQTGTISRYNTAESHSLMHYSQLCGTHQPRLCALELLPKEFTGGISDDPCRALHSNAARPRHTCAALITHYYGYRLFPPGETVIIK